jgi:hypothetical protein
MSDRRYREDEVRKIFKLATTERVAKAPAPTSEGLTLAEIQSIGSEVGVDGEVIARAAASLDATALEHKRTTLGAPVEVGRVVPLDRAMTDHEWEQTVALLRSTFRARGELTGHGTLREWRNGNLFASHEPSGDGYRLRIGTKKGNVAGFAALGGMGILASAITLVEHILVGSPPSLLPSIAFGAVGIGTLAANLLRLPPWARRREKQMTHIAATIKAIMDRKDT